MKRSVGIVLLLLILPAIASAQTAVRDIPDCVTLGEEFQVRFSVNLGTQVSIGGIVEQVPNGFVVTDTGTSDPNNVTSEYDPNNNTVSFTWIGKNGTFEAWYNATAPNTAGSYTFSAKGVVFIGLQEYNITVQDSVLQVADTCAPTPSGGSGGAAGVVYKNRDVTLGNPSLAGPYLKFENVQLFDPSTGLLKYDYTPEGKVTIKYPGLGASSVEIKVVKLTTGDTRTYTDSGPSGSREILMSGFTSGNYRVEVTWYDDSGKPIYSLNTQNPTTWSNTIIVEGIGQLASTPSSVVLALTQVTKRPEISISVDGPSGSSVAKGDLIYFSVDIDGFETGMYWTWHLQGPYYGEMVAGGPITNSAGDIILNTGDLVEKHGGQTGSYLFVVVVYDASGRKLNYETATWTLEGIDISVVSPTEAKIGNKIRIVAQTNVAETNGDYDDASVANYANITMYYSEYNFTTGMWEDKTWAYTNLPIKDGVIETPVTKLLRPNFATGSYKIEIEVVTAVNATTGKKINETEVKYFQVREPTITFDMDTVYVRGEDLQFTGSSDVYTEKAVHVALDIKDYIWIFITPVGDQSKDGSVWDNLIEDYSPAIVNTVTSLSDIPKDGFVQFNNQIGLLAVIKADRTFKTDEYTIAKDAPKRTYTFEGYIAYWEDGAMRMSDYKAIISIKVVKEKVEVNVDPSTLTKAMEFRLSGVAPRDDDVVYVFTDEKDIVSDVPKLPRDDEKFIVNVSTNQYCEGDTWCTPGTTPYTLSSDLYVINTAEDTGEFSVILKVNEEDVDPGTYIIYVIQPADTDDSDGLIFDPTEDPIGMATITIKDFGFMYVPTKFEMVPGDYRDFMVKIFGDPDKVTVEMDIEGHGVNIRDIPLVKYNESEDGSSGWMFATLYTFYRKAAEGEEKLADEFEDFDTTIPLKPGTSYVISLELKDDSGTVDTANSVLAIIKPEMKVTVPSQIVAGETFEIKIDTNHMSKGYDDIHVIIDYGTGVLTKYLSIPLDENGDAVIEINTAGWKPGTYDIWVRDRMMTYYTTGSYSWDWNKHYDYAPVGESEVDYPALKAVAAQDDFVVKRPIKVLESAAVVTTTTTTTTVVEETTTTTTTTTVVEETTTTTTTTTTAEEGGGGIPGFEAVFAIAGLLAVAYLLRRQ